MIYEYRIAVEEVYAQIVEGVDPDTVRESAPSDEALVEAIHTCYEQLAAELAEELEYPLGLYKERGEEE